MKRSDLRALILEDEEALMDVFKKVLKSIGIKNIDEAINEQEALSFLDKKSPYELFLLDTYGPCSFGPNFLKKARKLGYESKTIAMSSDTNAVDLWVNESKADYFIEKPFDINKLKRIVIQEFPEA